MDKLENLNNSLKNREFDTAAAVSAPTPDYAAQRRFPRIKCFIAVQLRPESDHGLVLGNLSDVSLGGCGLESAIHVPASTPVALSPLTAAGELWVRGVAVNSRFSEGTSSFHIGVKFLEEPIPSAEHRPQEFVQFIEQAAAQQAPRGDYLNKLWGL